MYPIEAVGVRKGYGEVAALQGVSVRVGFRSAVGLVGPNGAGKSSLLRILCGLARPDAGTVRLGGADPLTDPVTAKQSLGVLPELPPLFELLTGAEHLAWVGRLRGVPDDLLEHRLAELGTALDLAGAMSRPISGYSKGMRQKLAFAAALIHDPRILVLDEPFEGVDALSVRAMKGVIRQFVTAGAAVLLSSHILPLVEDVCDRFVIITEGRLVFDADRDALEREALRATAGSVSPGHALESILVNLVAPGRMVHRLQSLACGEPSYDLCR